jgi:nucleotide-binding universal stress UspA family protein
MGGANMSIAKDLPASSVTWCGAIPANSLQETSSMIEFHHILVPTDFSEPSLAATRYGLEFARRFGATLHLLHVIEDPKIYVPLVETFPYVTREDLETAARTELENWILPEDAAGVTIKSRFVHGKPFVEIVRDAREHAADLIVLGTHGRGPAAHLLLGAWPKVVRKASCPVLTVRARTQIRAST